MQIICIHVDALDNLYQRNKVSIALFVEKLKKYYHPWYIITKEKLRDEFIEFCNHTQEEVSILTSLHEVLFFLLRARLAADCCFSSRCSGCLVVLFRSVAKDMAFGNSLSFWIQHLSIFCKHKGIKPKLSNKWVPKFYVCLEIWNVLTWLYAVFINRILLCIIILY